MAWNKDRLYVGDIGDNDSKRKTIRVYYFDDPKPDDETRTYKAWDFRYPDGPHDAETLLVTAAGPPLHRDQGAQGRPLRGAREAQPRAA